MNQLVIDAPTKSLSWRDISKGHYMDIKLWQLVVALLGTGTVSSVVTAVVTAIINRKVREAQIDDIQASAAQKVVEASQGLLTSMSERIGELEKESRKDSERYADLRRRYDELKKENQEIKRELCLVKKQYQTSVKENELLKSRIKLLAKIVTQIVEASDSASCVDDLVNGMQITQEEREFLIGVVEEANHIKWNE